MAAGVLERVSVALSGPQAEALRPEIEASPSLRLVESVLRPSSAGQQADVLVVDSMKLGPLLLQTIARLTFLLPDTRVVLCASEDADAWIIPALEAGMAGLVDTTIPVSDVPRLIHAAAAGEIVLPRRLHGHLLRQLDNRRRDLQAQLQARMVSPDPDSPPAPVSPSPAPWGNGDPALARRNPRRAATGALRVGLVAGSHADSAALERAIDSAAWLVAAGRWPAQIQAVPPEDLRRVDVLLVEPAPGADVFVLLHGLRRRGRDLPLLLVGRAHDDPEIAVQRFLAAWDAGATGYVAGAAHARVLDSVLRTVWAGDVALPRNLAPGVLRVAAARLRELEEVLLRFATLTPEEHRAVLLVGMRTSRGRASAAAALGRRYEPGGRHLHGALRKLECASASELAAFLQRHPTVERQLRAHWA
jgi:DNA-binding NarL/FixJ family response regulator